MRYFVFIGLLLIAWSVMTSIHELGHLIGGWCGGARLTDLDLVPWRLPYSLHNPDPNPQLTLWGGPIFGVMIPIAVAMATRHRWMWLVADFCLLANGAYLAVGWLAGDRFLDTPRMLAAGVHPLAIAVYCCATISLGYVRFRSDCIALLSPKPAVKTPS